MLPVHKARSHPEKLKRWVDMSMLPPKKPLLHSRNHYWVSLWCPENGSWQNCFPALFFHEGRVREGEAVRWRPVKFRSK